MERRNGGGDENETARETKRVSHDYYTNLAGFFKCRPKTKPIFKNIPRRIFKDRRDAWGVGYLRRPPTPFHG